MSAALYLGLATLAVATLVLMQQLRQGTDIVNSVNLTERRASLLRGEVARIAFNLDRPDGAGSIEVIDSDNAIVRTLRSIRAMPARRYRISWAGGDEEGQPADPGNYRIQVTLREQDREIVVPGLIKVPGGTE